MIRLLTILLVLQGLLAANSSPRFSKIGDPRNKSNRIVPRAEILPTAGATTDTVEETDRSFPNQESKGTTVNVTSADKTTDSGDSSTKNLSTIQDILPKLDIVAPEKIDSAASTLDPRKKQPTNSPVHSNQSTPPKPGSQNWVPWVAAVVIIVVGGVIAALLCFFIRRERKKRQDKGKKAGSPAGGGSHVSPSASRISATSPGGRRSSAEDSGDNTDSRDYGQPSVHAGLWAQKTVVEKSFKSAPVKSTEPVSPKQATASLKGVTSIASKTAFESMHTAHTAKMPESLTLDESHGKAGKIVERQPPHASPSIAASSSHGHS